MPDPVSVYRDAVHINDPWGIRVPQSYAAAKGAHFNFVPESWSVSTKDQDEHWVDYYLVSLSGTLSYALHPSLYLDEYQISSTPLNASDATLIAHSPPTTEGSTSITSSISTSLSSSVGFFGADPTASLGESVSFGKSETRSIPDVAVQDHSMDQANEGSWTYAIAESAPAQGSNLEIYHQMLWSLPRQPDRSTLKLSTGLVIKFSDHDDDHGTRYYDDYRAGARKNFDALGATYTDLDDRIGLVVFPPHPSILKRSPVS